MITVKRYIVLVGESYYPAGWDDFIEADTYNSKRALTKIKLVLAKIKKAKFT